MQQSTPESTFRSSVVYALCDQSNNIRYIGITCQSLDCRLQQHLHDARAGDRTYRSNWIRSLSQSPAIVRIEETCDREREKYWIAFCRQRGDNLTNATDGGEGMWGNVPSAETRAKRSRSLKGRIITEEARRKISLKSAGRKHSPETRAKIAAKLKERFPDGRIGPNTGHRHTDETKRKISIAHRALIAANGVRPVTAKTRAKLSASSKKQVHRSPSEETREKLRAAQAARREREKSQLGGIQNPYKGVPRSEETKAKMRDAWVLRRQK